MAHETSPKFEFVAKISKGSGRGARLGFPTINLDKTDLDLNYGIYLVESQISGKIYKGLLHFGQKETFDEPASNELYIKEYLPNLSGQTVKVKEIRKIREVLKFKTPEELKQQMLKDLHELENGLEASE